MRYLAIYTDETATIQGRDFTDLDEAVQFCRDEHDSPHVGIGIAVWDTEADQPVWTGTTSFGRPLPIERVYEARRQVTSQPSND